MEFSERLNALIIRVGCSASQLASASGVSDALISRYRSGERIPEKKSPQLDKLVEGLSALASDKHIQDLTPEIIRNALNDCIREPLMIDSDVLAGHLNSLITVMNINVTEMSRTLNFDASYLSRLRSGQRKPADAEALLSGICSFAIKRFRRIDDRNALAKLIGIPSESMADDQTAYQNLYDWMISIDPGMNTQMEDFLKKLDTFNLDEYIRSIHFDEIKVPSVPFQLPVTKVYTGIEQMKKGEIEFFKSTILSKSNEPVFMCSDMPMEDMAEDVEFGKKWMMAIAVSLKKGLHLNIIHNTDRPFAEMMLGLESWIPIYMTGQVSPYVLKGVQNNVYCHFCYVSGAVALSGECVAGYHNDGRYILTGKKEEVAYFRRRSDDLFHKAQPLMEIFRSEDKNKYTAFLSKDASSKGTRHRILSCLPICTCSEDLLIRILKQNQVNEENTAKLYNYRKQQMEQIGSIMEHDEVIDEIADLTEEEFNTYPMTLSVSGAFFEQDLHYTYEQYKEYMQETLKYEEMHANYHLKMNRKHTFRNIQILIHSGEWVIISKNKTPVIHFLIRNAKMMNAIENFTAPVDERIE